MKLDERLAQILGALERRHNVLLYGPPGTGKTFLMTKVMQAFLQPAPNLYLREDADTDFLEELVLPLLDRPCRRAWWITFHQSYGYEDFVVGLRTAPGATFSLRAQQGPLIEAAEHARLADGSSLLLVDEVNRGNTSRIFGEFITLMESSKRLGPDGAAHGETVAVRLPNVEPGSLKFDLTRHCQDGSTTVAVDCPVPFEMPWHVFTLASMNSVDRTVAPLDAAIRRRFEVIELQPDYALLAELLDVDELPDQYGQLPSNSGDLLYWRKLALLVLFEMNRRIRALAGSDYELGHSYLMGLAGAATVPEFKLALKDVLQNNLVPQLQELLRTDPEMLGGALSACEPNELPGYPYRFEDPPLGIIGSRKSLVVRDLELSALETVARRLAGLP